MTRRIGLLLVLAVSCFGQQAKDHNLSYGNLNGRGWLERSESYKLGYLQGLVDGITSTVMPRTLTLGEVSTALDRFYEDPLNLDMPVVWALQLIKRRAEGTATFERELAGMRKRLTDKPPR